MDARPGAARHDADAATCRERIASSEGVQTVGLDTEDSVRVLAQLGPGRRLLEPAISTGCLALALAALDLMARLAGLMRRHRWGSTARDAFSAASRQRVSVYERVDVSGGSPLG